MHKLTALAVFTIITACGGAALAPHGPVGLDRGGIKNAIASSVRIRGYCNGELVGYGSGVAVSAHHVITARHITQMCEDSETPDMATFELVSPDGTVRQAIGDVDAKNSDIDVGRLVATDGMFVSFAPISVDGPEVGDDVFIYAGDGGMDITDRPFHFKRGSVSRVDSTTVTISFHGVPGNSGSAIFDRFGNVIGILHSGAWQSSREFWIDADRPSSWVDLFPPYEMDLGDTN